MEFRSLPGLTSYADARSLQLELVEARAADKIPDTCLLLEHVPVITQGRGLQFTGQARPRHMPLPSKMPVGIEFSETERGGDLTYHGPGQLVVYPICKLDGSDFGPKKDIEGFLRKLEQAVISAFSHYGLQAETRSQATGVWVGEKKVVSIGLAIKKWVTYHGVAINCTNDLSPFDLISPCGFDSKVMARVLDLVSDDIRARWKSGHWRNEFETILCQKLVES